IGGEPVLVLQRGFGGAVGGGDDATGCRPCGRELTVDQFTLYGGRIDCSRGRRCAEFVDLGTGSGEDTPLLHSPTKLLFPLLSLITLSPPSSTLFPYTTLFRSIGGEPVLVLQRGFGGAVGGGDDATGCRPCGRELTVDQFTLYGGRIDCSRGRRCAEFVDSGT